MKVSKLFLIFVTVVAVFAGVKWMIDNDVFSSIFGTVGDSIPSVDFKP